MPPILPLPLRRLFVLAFWGAVAFAYVSALLPPGRAPAISLWDKLNHAIAFFVITLLGRLAYPRVPVPMAMLLLGIFGAAIELSQAVPIFHRNADLIDWVADMVAAGIALLLAWPIAAWARRRPPL